MPAAVDGIELRLLKNPNSNLIQYEFNSKNNIDPDSQNFDDVVAEQAANSTDLKMNLTQAEADKIFQLISRQKGIPFENVILSYCFDRAQAIDRLLEINGYQSQKIFAEGLFIIDDVFSHSGKISKKRWTSHVAATIQVLNELGEAETQVIDPSLADHLLKLPEWFNILTQYTKMSCKDDTGKTYGAGSSGCLFQEKSKYHYRGNDFSADLHGWDTANWEKTVNIMKEYYRGQILHGK